MVIEFYTLQNLQDSQTVGFGVVRGISFTPFKTYKTLKRDMLERM